MINPIPQIERPAVRMLLTYSIVTAASYIISRTVGDSLFLARVGNANLALFFVISGIVTALVASLWHLTTRRLTLSRTLQLSGVTFAVVTLAAWWALPRFHHSIGLIGAIYLLTEVKGCINAINIVSAMNETLGSHSTRRSWTRVGLGVPLAGITFGSILGIEAAQLSLRNWLLVTVLLD